MERSCECVGPQQERRREGEKGEEVRGRECFDLMPPTCLPLSQGSLLCLYTLPSLTSLWIMSVFLFSSPSLFPLCCSPSIVITLPLSFHTLYFSPFINSSLSLFPALCISYFLSISLPFVFSLFEERFSHAVMLLCLLKLSSIHFYLKYPERKI